ncbi:MAG TPA: FCD domain-containing protein [Amycolatopsis sp.]|nr:FCD domain-containing protein [Amycolatopsis sp.]
MVTSAAVPAPTGVRTSDHGREEKLASSVARAIEDDIVAAGWPVGSVFGSESDLIARYGISRAVFREAIRLVEHHHVAVMRRGPSGGLVIKEPDAAAAVTAAVVYLEFAGSTVADLLGVRLLLEPIVAFAAAENITEEGIVALRAAVDEPVNTPATGSTTAPAHRDLHVKLAELSGNPALQLFVEVLVRLTERYARWRRTSKAERTATLAQVESTHRAIVDAVIGGDAATAQHYMAAHLEAMSQWFSGTQRRIASRRATTRPGTATADGRKLAEVIAEEMREDIITGGWRIGDVVGSEGELQERYEVSRSALREAVRLLEHHSVARMRRGQGGGLVVTEPDPSPGVEAMALYLDYRGSTAHDLLTVRKALELGCIDTAIDTAEQPATRERLRGTLTVKPGTPEGELERMVHDLHLALADLHGNPVLTYFLRTITSLWRRHGSGMTGATALPPPEAAAAVEKAHSALVDAILAGDRGLARHRLTRHLDALPAWWH